MPVSNSLQSTAASSPAKQPTSYRGTITHKESVTQNIIHLTAQTDQPLPYQSGQYTMLAVNGTQRAFSFATPPGTTILEFFIDTSPGGVASRYVNTAVVGQTLTLSQAYGSFTVIPDQRPLLFIAGGVGIAPLRAQIMDCLSTGRPMTLLFGHRHAARIFLDDEFRALAAAGRLTYQPVCETPPAPWSGLVGRVSDTIAGIPNLDRYSIYVCGSPGMISTTTNELYRHGAALAHVHMEIFT